MFLYCILYSTDRFLCLIFIETFIDFYTLSYRVPIVRYMLSHNDSHRSLFIILIGLGVLFYFYFVS